MSAALQGLQLAGHLACGGDALPHPLATSARRLPRPLRRDAEPFDWYTDFARLSRVLADVPRGGGDALVLGCGSSRLSSELHAAGGFPRCTSIDWSPAVIASQAARAAAAAGLTFRVADATCLAFAAAASFDIVVDKGCLDSVLCSDASLVQAAALVREARRVLRPGGVYVCVSHAPPEARMAYIAAPLPVDAGAGATPAAASPDWTITVHAIRAFDCSGRERRAVRGYDGSLPYSRSPRLALLALAPPIRIPRFAAKPDGEGMYYVYICASTAGAA